MFEALLTLEYVTCDKAKTQDGEMYFILFYEVVKDHVTRRTPYREEHLRLLNEAHKRGELVMAGAFSETARGAAPGFRPHDVANPTRFSEHHPHTRHRPVIPWKG